MPGSGNHKLIASNRRARYNYNILETYEAGIVLTGSEIKSVRENHVDIREAFVQVRNGEAWLHNSNIAQYRPAGPFGQHDQNRSRKLLLHKKQIVKIESELQKQQLTAVPLRVYIKGRLAKIEFGLARGKTNVDRRNTIKEREAQREIGRAIRSRG